VSLTKKNHDYLYAYFVPVCVKNQKQNKKDHTNFCINHDFFSNDKNPTKEYTNNILIWYQKDQLYQYVIRKVPKIYTNKNLEV